jgi:hypothetical protein
LATCFDAYGTSVTRRPHNFVCQLIRISWILGICGFSDVLVGVVRSNRYDTRGKFKFKQRLRIRETFVNSRKTYWIATEAAMEQYILNV